MRLIARLYLFFVLSVMSLAAPLVQDGRPKRKVPQDTESDTQVLRTPFATVADISTAISVLTTKQPSKPVETTHAPAVADESPQSSAEAASRTISEDDANITDTPATSRTTKVHSDAGTMTDPTRESDTRTQETPFATPTSSTRPQAPAVGEKLPHSTIQPTGSEDISSSSDVAFTSREPKPASTETTDAAHRTKSDTRSETPFATPTSSDHPHAPAVGDNSSKNTTESASPTVGKDGSTTLDGHTTAPTSHHGSFKTKGLITNVGPLASTGTHTVETPFATPTSSDHPYPPVVADQSSNSPTEIASPTVTEVESRSSENPSTLITSHHGSFKTKSFSTDSEQGFSKSSADTPTVETPFATPTSSHRPHAASRSSQRSAETASPTTSQPEPSSSDTQSISRTSPAESFHTEASSTSSGETTTAPPISQSSQSGPFNTEVSSTSLSALTAIPGQPTSQESQDGSFNTQDSSTGSGTFTAIIPGAPISQASQDGLFNPKSFSTDSDSRLSASTSNAHTRTINTPSVTKSSPFALPTLEQLGGPVPTSSSPNPSVAPEKVFDPTLGGGVKAEDHGGWGDWWSGCVVC